MRAWLVRPISCPELIEERQNSIEFLMDPSFKELRLRLRASVKAMKDTEKLMTRIQNLRSTANEVFSSEESDGVGQFGAQLLTNTVGLRPLHYVVLWPVVRINLQCVDR